MRIKNTKRWSWKVGMSELWKKICPKNQSHSCDLFLIKEHHFKKGSPLTIQLYNRFVSIFQDFDPILIEPLKNIIAIKKNSQFLTIP